MIVPYHVFTPQPDITTYELALLIGPLGCRDSQEAFMLEIMSTLPYEVFRHFAHGDELREKAYQWARDHSGGGNDGND